MPKLVRFTLYVLLLALFVSLGDGPFLDEIMAEESQQQQQVAAAASGEQSPTAPASCMSVYHTLLNFLETEPAPLFCSVTAHHGQISFAPQVFASRFIAPLDKPPRSFV